MFPSTACFKKTSSLSNRKWLIHWFLVETLVWGLGLQLRGRLWGLAHSKLSSIFSTSPSKDKNPLTKPVCSASVISQRRLRMRKGKTRSTQLGPLLRKLVAGMTLRWRKALFFKYLEKGQREMTLPLPTDPHSPSSLKTSWPLCMVSGVTLHPEGNLRLVSTHAPKTAEPCPAAVLFEHETEVWCETLQFPDWILERQWEILVSCFLRTPESYYLLKKTFWFTVIDSM